MENLNVWSLVISTLIPMVMGFIYYSKPLLGKPWMDSIGMTEEKQKEANMGMVMGVSLLMSLILSFFVLGFCNMPGQEGEFDTFGHGAFHGAILGIFIVLPVFVTNGLFEQKGWKNILINVLYWGLTLALMGGILDVMNHWPNEMPG